MIRKLLVLVASACGASPPPQQQPIDQMGRPPIRIEWRAAQGDGDLVLVSIVVDGKLIDLGTLSAATEMEAGTPRTCAVRAAHPLRTEFTCGELVSFYAAELQTDELVLSVSDLGTRRELQRLPVYGDGLAVKPYAMTE